MTRTSSWSDEPTGLHLDSATSLMIFDLFRGAEPQGFDLAIIVTHNKDLARRAEKMYTLRDGKDQGLRDFFVIFMNLGELSSQRARETSRSMGIRD